MSSPLDKWQEYTDANSDKLRVLILQKCKQDRVKQHGIAAGSGCNETTLSKWLTRTLAKIPETAYYQLVLYASARGWLDHPGRLPIAMADLLNVKNDPEAWAALTGHYEVYRFSFLAPGKILRGALHIETRDVSHHRILSSSGRRERQGIKVRSDRHFLPA